jgi:outer membrane murein-binding lipoprotein Lpp
MAEDDGKLPIFLNPSQNAQSFIREENFNYGKIFPKEGMCMKKQFLVISMITIVLASVFVAGCTGGVKNTTSPSNATSTATTTSKVNATTSKVNATTIRSLVPSPKATPVPTATPSKTPTIRPIAQAAGCNFIGDSSTHIFHSAWCPCVKNIKPEHKVCFATAQQAIAAGYRS